MSRSNQGGIPESPSVEGENAIMPGGGAMRKKTSNKSAGPRSKMIFIKNAWYSQQQRPGDEEKKTDAQLCIR